MSDRGGRPGRSGALIAALAASGLILLVTLAVYGRGLGGYFMADDFTMQNFARMTAELGWQSVKWFWASRQELGVPDDAIKLYRPLADLSYTLQFLIWGSEPVAYRAFNLLLHAINSSLLMGILWRFTPSRPGALAAGLLFAASPAHPESLLWIASRVNLLATFWILSGVLCFLDRRLRVLASGLLPLLCTAGAVTSKETGVILPPLLTLLAWFFPLRERHGAARIGEVLRETWKPWLLLAAYFVVRHHALGTAVGGYPASGVASAEFWISRLRVVGLLVSPVHLDEVGWTARAGLGLVVATIACLGVRAFLAQDRRTGLAVMGILGAWLVLLLAATFSAPFGDPSWTELRHTRLLYEPSCVVALLFGCAFAGLEASAPRRAGIVLGSLVLAYGTVAWMNSGPWLEMGRASASIRDQVTVWADDDFPERWLVDVPGVEKGAFLFLGRNPELYPFVYPAGLAARVRLVPRAGWETVLRLVDQELRAGRASQLELFRFCMLDHRIDREPVSGAFPCRLDADLVVQYGRLGVNRAEAGGIAPVQVLLAAPPDASEPPLLVAELLRGDEVVATATHPAAAGALSWDLLLPEDLDPGEFRITLRAGSAACELGTLRIVE